MDETLSSKILKFRVEKNLSQKQLAKKIGIAEGTMMKAESDGSKGKILKITEMKILNYIEKNS